ncbi:hypothetical protein LTR50_005381 [Elasticomyces elasticus]|nr:hypothetical protein LTR50_005381 [Elasticomyces elasticus]
MPSSRQGGKDSPPTLFVEHKHAWSDHPRTPIRRKTSRKRAPRAPIGTADRAGGSTPIVDIRILDDDKDNITVLVPVENADPHSFTLLKEYTYERSEFLKSEHTRKIKSVDETPIVLQNVPIKAMQQFQRWHCQHTPGPTTIQYEQGVHYKNAQGDILAQLVQFWNLAKKLDAEGFANSALDAACRIAALPNGGGILLRNDVVAKLYNEGDSSDAALRQFIVDQYAYRWVCAGGDFLSWREDASRMPLRFMYDLALALATRTGGGNKVKTPVNPAANATTTGGGNKVETPVNPAAKCGTKYHTVRFPVRLDDD